MKLPVSLLGLPVPRHFNAVALFLVAIFVAAGRSQWNTIGRVANPNLA